MKSAPIYFIDKTLISMQLRSICTVFSTYINRELPTHPYQLCRICLNLPYPADVRLQRIDSIFAKLIDYLEIACERARMLVILGADVCLDRLGELDCMSAPEGSVGRDDQLLFAR